MFNQAARKSLPIDCAIIGGGVAGLWLLNCLRGQGYNTLLFENAQLGGAQTAASQGIIHGGLKFALGGIAGEASRAVADMPAAWRACLQGKGDVDLRGVRVLSEQMYLLADGSATGRLAQLAATQLLRARVRKLSAKSQPPALQTLTPSGSVYELDEPVLDVPSLVAALSRPQREYIYAIDWAQSQLSNTFGEIAIDMPGCSIAPRRLILCAGAGNEQLLADMGASQPRMQRRPLQQLILRHESEVPLFAHFIGAGNTPRVTITSHRTAQGQPLWYLGGELATAGVGEAPGVLAPRARRELERFLPGLDLGHCEWSCLAIDRAEPKQDNSQRPDDVFLQALTNTNNVLVAWPTKLALCPRLGEVVVEQLRDQGITPGPPVADMAGLPQGEALRSASSPWDALN